MVGVGEIPVGREISVGVEDFPVGVEALAGQR